jgi:TolA-binding protein
MYSCAATPDKGTEKVKPQETEQPPEEAQKGPAHTEEEEKSLEVFAEILALVESTNDRKSVLPKIEALYEKIIREYPDAPLAQESYFKLITIYLEDYSPPEYDKAEMMYEEFLDKYPQSFFKGFIEDTLGNSYYKNGDWDRLLKFTSPAYQEYHDKGKQPRASMLFMYSEANYRLGNMKKAEEGYQLVAALYPKLIVGIKSKKMLEKMEKQ